MKNILIKIRNGFFHFAYAKILKPIFFLFDPELMHNIFTLVGKILGSNIITQKLTQLFFDFSNPTLEQKILGIHFKNPIGLSAGFDKNATLTNVMPFVGFGFEEIGSITGEACDGNQKPRMWREPKKKSIRVNMGLNNDGAEKISARLKDKKMFFPIGTSIAKTNSEATCSDEAGVKDYVKGFKKFTEIGDYFTINLSCPNAFGGQPFTDPKKLQLLLTEIDKIPTKKPIFLKVSPDLSLAQLDDLIKVAQKHRVHGYIATNLTKQHSLGKGGLSGKAVEDKANRVIAHIYKRTAGKAVIMGCGGIFTAHDAYLKIRAGASLLQLITSMIYEGPQVISAINLGLVELLKKDGYKNVSEAVGK